MPSALFRDCIRMLEFAGSRGAHSTFSSLLCTCYSPAAGEEIFSLCFTVVFTNL